MRRFVLVLVLAGLACLTAAAADVSGKWSGTFSTEQNPNGTAFAILTQNGSEITGTAGPDEQQQWKIQKGKIAGNKVTIDVTSDDGMLYSCDLVLSGDNLKGSVTVGGPSGQKAKLEMARLK